MTKTGEVGANRRTKFAWKRGVNDQVVSERLGQRIRHLREKLNVSLSAASELTGIPAATLSRIENNKMSPTFPVLVKLMTGLRLPWIDLMGEDAASIAAVEPSISMPDDQAPISVPGYAYTAPHQDHPLCAHVQPLVFDVFTDDLESVGGLRGHQGFEFVFVLSGTIEFHMQGKDPIDLPPGGSLLINSEVPHAYLKKGDEPAKGVIVTFIDPVLQSGRAPFSDRTPKPD